MITLKTKNTLKRIFVFLGVLACLISACGLKESTDTKVTPIQEEIPSVQDEPKVAEVPKEEVPKVKEEPMNPEVPKIPQITEMTNVPIIEQPKKENAKSVPKKPNERPSIPVVTSPVAKPEAPKKDNENIGDYIKRLTEIAHGAQNYYTENFSKTRIITKNGLMYNKASEEVMNVQYLCDNDAIDKKYRGLDCSILLMNGQDLATFDELSINGADNGLTVFVSARHPKDEKYIISSANGSGGVLTSERYKELLNKYNQSHGGISKLANNVDEYDRILGFIKMYESKFEDYFVRSIVSDNKYASVILSSTASISDVRQYILVKDGSFWEVVMDDLESEPRVVVAVNKKLPDFNINMLPKYTLNDYKGNMRSNFGDIILTMKTRDMISDISEVSYMAGAGKFSYIVCNNGRKYLCEQKNDSWEITSVIDEIDAASRMESKDKKAPTFIILDRQ